MGDWRGQPAKFSSPHPPPPRRSPKRNGSPTTPQSLSGAVAPIPASGCYWKVDSSAPGRGSLGAPNDARPRVGGSRPELRGGQGLTPLRGFEPRVARVAATLVVTGACTAYVLWKIDIGRTAHVLAHARLPYFLGSVAIIPLAVP